MALFIVEITRIVEIMDGCHRLVEAETAEEAQRIAQEHANAYNHDCPDDVAPCRGGCDDIGDFVAGEPRAPTPQEITDNGGAGDALTREGL